MSSAVEVPSINPPPLSSGKNTLSSLSPVTQQRLGQFSSRESAQKAIRGVGWTVVATVALLLISVVVDSQIYHPATRWWLWVCIVGTVLLGFVVGCIRPIFMQPQWSAIARRMEKLEPKLRNQLLSAVELAIQPPVNDSMAFRHQVQRGVATLIGPVDIVSLLPGRLVRRPLAYGIAAAGLLTLLCFVPSLHLPQRLSRILLPWANIGRISSVVIHIEAPDVSLPASELIIPRGEMTGIVARIEGPKPEQVFLQTRVLESPLSQQTILMSQLRGIPQGDIARTNARPVNSVDEAQSGSLKSDPLSNRYETVLPVDAESLEFRVLASGAETPWYQLTTIPRPQIDQFEILVMPPAYTQLPSQEYKSQSADITVLEGSRVRLTLATTPSATELSGQLLWVSQSTQTPATNSPQDSLATPPSQPLRIDKQGNLFTEFTVDSEREFKLDLQHRESGIKNDFSPTFRLHVIRDLAPQVAWVWPTTSSLIVSKEELSSLTLTARDELSIDTAVGRFRINAQEWVQVELQPDVSGNNNPGADSNGRTFGYDLKLTNLKWMFDLSKLVLEDGDFLDLEVSATDRKQQTGNSPTLRVMISTLKSDLAPSSLELSRQQIKLELAELSRAAKPLADAVIQLRDKNTSTPPEVLRKFAEHNSQLQQQTVPKVAELRQKIETLLHEPQDRISQQELRSFGQLLEKWQNQMLPSLTNAHENAEAKLETSEFAQAGDEKARQQLINPLVDLTKQMADEISQTAENFEMLADNDAAQRISKRSLQLAEVANQLIRQVAEPEKSSEVLARRREILSRQVSELGLAMEQSQRSAGKHLENQLQHTRQQLQHVQAVLDRPIAEFAQQAASIPQTLVQIRSHLASSIQQQANHGRRRITGQAGTSGQRMVEAIRQWDNGSTQAQATTDKSADRLKGLRSLLTSGDGADRQFGADLGNAQRALQQSMKTTESTQQQATQVREIAASVRKLEAAHALEQANNTLSQILLREGQTQYQQEMLLEHPRLWDNYTEQLERSVRLMRDAQIPNEIVGKTEQLQWNQAAGQASERLGERIWSNEPMTTAKPQLLQLSSSLQEMREQLSEIADQARQSLLQQAPSLSQLAQEAANSAAELMDETLQLAENLEERKVPEPNARLDSLKRQLEPAGEPLQTLLEALVDLAGSQNMLDEQQIEQARKADAAIHVVSQAEKKLAGSFEMTQRSNSADQQSAQQSAEQMAGELQQAASTQSDVAESMRRLADFFETSGKENLAEQALTDATNADKATEQNNDQAYEQAERLSRIAGLSPEQMLKSLERQLQNNPPMQAEMSEIALDATEQALRQLDRAQKRQDTVIPSLEQSDPRVKMQKELMAHDLNTAKNDASHMLQTLLQEANSSAQAGQVSQPANRLQQEIQQLQQSLSELPYINSSASAEELQATAKQISSALDRVGVEAAEIEKTLGEAAKTAAGNPNDQQKDRQLRDAQARRDRVKNHTNRQAEQSRKSQQDAVNAAQNQLRTAAQELKNLQNQLGRTEQELKKQPDQQWLQESADRQRRELALGEAKLESIRQFQEALDQRKQAAEQFSNETKQAAAAELNQPNAYAQLAQSLSQQASQTAQRFADKIDQWEEKLSIATEASGQELASQAAQQANVQNQVQSAAQDLARAARHETRLNQQTNSQQLSQLSAAAKQVAEQPLQTSRDQLAQAQQTSTGKDRPTGQASAEATEASIAAAEEASRAIEGAAQAVRETLERDLRQGSTDSPTSSPSTSQSSSPSSAAMFSPQQMAQLLDELDRQLNTPGLPSQANPQSATSKLGSRSQPPATLAQAAQQLAERMSRQRQSASQSASQAESPSKGQSESQPSSLTSKRSESSRSLSTSRANSSDSTLSGSSMSPQAADSVRLLDVTRLDSAWGELRQQEATQTVESQRQRSPSRYRRAIDAYFKALAESTKAESTSTGKGAKDGSSK